MSDAPTSGYLAIDLGPSRLMVGIVDRVGEVVVRDRVATPSRGVWPALASLVSRVLAANPTLVTPRAVGVTCPGPIDHLTGAMKPVGMPTWHDFPLRRELAAIADLPVHVDTAGRGLALAELWRAGLEGIDPGTQNFATLALGDDVDGALVARGRLLQGLTGNLGQFGHLVVEPDGAECPCGARGCLTAYVGARAIGEVTGRELRRTPPATIEHIGIMTARACASIAAMFDVDQIMIGGVVAQNLAEPFFDAVQREFAQRAGLGHLASVDIQDASPHRNRLVAAAAVAHAVHGDEVFDEPDGDGDAGDEGLDGTSSSDASQVADIDGESPRRPTPEQVHGRPAVIVIDATGGQPTVTRREPGTAEDRWATEG